MQRVIKGERIQVGEPAGRTHSKGSGSAHHARARGVRLVKVDGRVAAIELTCSCGEVSVLELSYEEPKA